MVDNLLPDHVELPHVLDLAVHLLQLITRMGRRGHTETFSLDLWAKFESRGLDLSDWIGLPEFFRRMKINMTAVVSITYHFY